MKKALKILALILSVPGILAAEQDVLKNIKVVSEYRQAWIDKDGKDANRIGNAGFKAANKASSKWRNIISGELKLSDEWGLGTKFSILHDNDNLYEKRKRIDGKKEAWETNLEFTKRISIGSLNTDTSLGWLHKSTIRNKKNSLKHTSGISNEIYFGPTFSMKLFDQNITTTLQGVYFKSNGERNADYYLNGFSFKGGKTDGWGINARFKMNSNLYQGNIGKVNYWIDLNNKFRDPKGKIAVTGKEAKSSIKLVYVIGAKYTTPTFAGFNGSVSMDNEWEKHTIKTGYKNTVSVWTELGYSKSFDTAVGKISVNPFIKYRALQRVTLKDKNNKELKDFGYKRTTETNEMRIGLSIGLTVK